MAPQGYWKLRPNSLITPDMDVLEFYGSDGRLAHGLAYPVVHIWPDRPPANIWHSICDATIPPSEMIMFDLLYQVRA